jgi:hypothetical protein
MMAKLVASLTPTDIDDRVLKYVDAAWAAYVEVHGSPVTRVQLVKKLQKMW